MSELTPVEDPRYWYGVFASQFAPSGVEFGSELLSTALGVDDEDAFAWWSSFTREYPGVFDDADGYVGEPGSVLISMQSGFSLRIDYHPGGSHYWAALRDEERHMLGDTGPHWRLPALMLPELAHIADGTFDVAPAAAYLALLPLAWPDSDSTAKAGAARISEAFVALRLTHPRAAADLANAWRAGFDAAARPQWAVDAYGPVCDSPYSLRGPTAAVQERRILNEVLASVASRDIPEQ